MSTPIYYYNIATDTREELTQEIFDKFERFVRVAHVTNQQGSTALLIFVNGNREEQLKIEEKES